MTFVSSAAMAGLALTLMVSAGAVHAQTADQASSKTPAPPPQTTAIIDPPIVHAPPPPDAPSKDNLTMPKWSEFPVPPTDVPTVSDIAARVSVQTDARTSLTAEVAALRWDGDVGQTFHDTTVSRLDPDMLKPVDAPMSADAIAAFGASLRKQAAPPPVAN